jgi:N-acetyl-anhydromuramyl-L-alanine amidase AmpD
MSWYPDLPHVQAVGDGGQRASTQVVVIHATDNTASDESEAQYASYRADGTSAHFYNDSDSVIQALDTDEVAYGCLPHGNAISVQFELCGHSDQLSDAAMRQAAPIVARVCAQYGIPIHKIGPAEVAAGERGICGHLDITAAFPQDNGDHTDPGGSFPWDTFISYVQGQGDDMSAETEAIIKYELEPWLAGAAQSIWRVEPAVAALQKSLDALAAVVNTLATHGTSVDTAAVLAAVQAVGATESAATIALTKQVEDLQAKLAAAEQAAANALAGKQ